MTGQGSRLHAHDLLGVAWSSLLASGARGAGTAVVTALGIAAITATLNLTVAAREQVSSRFDAVAATEVRVTPAGEGAFPDDTDERLGRLSNVRHAGLVGWLGDRAVAGVLVQDVGGRRRSTLPVMAVTPGGLRSLRPRVEGRLLHAADDAVAARVVVVGRDAATALGGRPTGVGHTLYVEGVPFTVVGVLDGVAREAGALSSVMAPRATMISLGLHATTEAAVMDVAPGAAIPVARQAPVALAPEEPDRFTAATAPDPRTLRMRVEADVATSLLVLGAIVLVVGALGIANSAMVSVIERTPELGLRRAIGARPIHLYGLVVVETTLLGGLGGLVGAVGGVVATLAVVAFNHWTPVMDARLVLVAPLAGAVLGAVAGLHPARRAARIEPTEALRR